MITEGERAGVITARWVHAMTTIVPPPSSVPYPPVEPEVVAVHFPDTQKLGLDELAAVSRTMSPGMVLAAYRRGIFPWPVNTRVIPWVCPRERAVYRLDEPDSFSRSLRKVVARGTFTVTFDRAFEQVIEACATYRDGGTWITPAVFRTYIELHQLGWAHSVEVWSEDGRLAGGLYGLAIGQAFAGESMFHRCPDASKVAFVHLVQHLRARGFTMLDAQVATDHLRSLGCTVIPRTTFLTQLEQAQRETARF
ncbi:MAG: leucyl/phenylalanyl-tRNA--protein transferase [Deltaproteobacteria bacterium]|nr:leucyl/phenylalanyl-tRNA--protein transferase [Deltaproteobacteria bacterium]